MTTLVEFLLARIAEDERRAHSGVVTLWARGRMLAECEAKRRIVELHSPQFSGLHICHDSNADDSDCEELRALGLIYADHPDYDAEWKP